MGFTSQVSVTSSPIFGVTPRDSNIVLLSATSFSFSGSLPVVGRQLKLSAIFSSAYRTSTENPNRSSIPAPRKIPEPYRSTSSSCSIVFCNLSASSSDKFCAIAWDESINCLISVALLESIMDTLPTKRLVNKREVSMIAITAITFLARFIFIKRLVNNRNVPLFSTFTIKSPPCYTRPLSETIFPSSICKIRSAIWAISSLWVIITMVW